MTSLHDNISFCITNKCIHMIENMTLFNNTNRLELKLKKTNKIIRQFFDKNKIDNLKKDNRSSLNTTSAIL